MIRIGIDLGGTKIEGVALDDDGAVLRRERVPTPRDDYEATLGTITDLVARIERDLRRRGTVGIGIPGAISPATGLVKNANSTWLIGRPLASDLSDRMGREVRVENDANCFARSEAADGAGADARIVFGVILGTGVGGGIVVDGRVVTGANAIAGEWGHNPLPAPRDGERPGPACYCGRSGCIETFLSGPALEREYAALAGASRPAIEIASRAGGAPVSVAQAFQACDDAAAACLARYEERLARALASVINILDPDVIVLGGGVSNVDRLYESVPRLWGAHVFSDAVRTRLAKARHGDSSGVRGAAWLWDV